MTVLFALICAFIITGCPLDNSESDIDNWALPAAIGINEVKGNTWYTLDTKVDYSADGTYTKSFSLRYAFKYRSIETGFYSWNETDRIIIHKPEAILFNHDLENTVLLTRNEYRQYINEMIRGWKELYGEDNVKEYLAGQGFSSEYDYSMFRLDSDFSGWTASYCLSNDGEALLMQDTLPGNIEPDQLSGKTYQHMENPDEYYIFEKNGDSYTYFFDGNTRDWNRRIINGIFAYDGLHKELYLLPVTVDGETLSEFYDSTEAYAGHGYPSDAACKAAEANNEFQLILKTYNPSVSVSF